MTNLFYPSVAVWYQKRSPARAPATSHAGPSRVTHLHGHEDPLSLLSTPLLDSFFPDPPSPIPPFVSRAIWDTDTTGETGWNGTRLPRRQGVRQHDEDEIRLVRVGWTDVAHISRYSSGHGHGQEHHSAQWLERDSHLLASIRDMVERWKGDYPGSREHCVRELISSEKKNGRAVSDGACVERSSRSGSGNESDQPGQDGGMYHHAEYFMRIPPSSVDSFHARWQASVQGVVQKTEGAILLDQSSRRVVSDPLSGEWRVTVSPLGILGTNHFVLTDTVPFEVAARSSHRPLIKKERSYSGRQLQAREPLLQILHLVLPRHVCHPRLSGQFRYPRPLKVWFGRHWNRPAVLFRHHELERAGPYRVEWVGLVELALIRASLGASDGDCHRRCREHVYSGEQDHSLKSSLDADTSSRRKRSFPSRSTTRYPSV